MLENQLSRYGAMSRPVDVPVGAKLFLVSDSDDTTVGPLNLAAEYPVDKDGVVRVYNTVQAAVNAAAANRGDLVKVLPGFDFSLGGVDSWDKAGVTIEGVGRGTMRPTIRFTAKASEVGLSANNIRVTGLRFLAATDSIARGVDIDTGFQGIHFDNNIFDFDSAGDDFRVMLRHGAKRSVIEDNVFRAADSGPASGSAIRLKGGDPDYTTIMRNTIFGQYDTIGDTSDGSCPIAQDTTDTSDTNLSGLLIQDNTIVNSDTAASRMIRFSAGYTIFGIARSNFFANFDSSSNDSTKVAGNSQVGSGLRFLGNRMNGDSGTEKIVGDTVVLGA